MKKRIIGIIVLVCLLLGACGKSSEPRLERSQLLGIDDVICSWGEAKIFILTQHTAYGQTYGESVWDVPLSDGNFESYIRDSLLEYLKTMMLAVYAAEQIGASLSEAEQREVNLAADAFMSDLKGSQGLGIQAEDVRNAYAHYAMAQIFYRQTITDSRLEISDEEARIISLQIVEMDASVGYEQASALAEEVKSGRSVSEIIKSYEGASLRTENISRGMYGSTLESIAFSLKQDQWSPVISEDGKYYILRCLSPFMEAETNRNKAEMAIRAREELLNKALRNYARTAQLIYNPELWDSWSMSQFTEAPEIDFFAYTANLEK